MRIAIISQCIFPYVSPRSFRTTELAKYFAKAGHEVQLFAVLGSYDYTLFEREYGVHVHSLGRMRLSTLNSDGYVRNSFLDKVFHRLLGRWLEFPDIELAGKTYSAIKRMEGIDLLITIAMPHPINWGAAWARKMSGNKFPKVWISDCGDPYMGNSVGKTPPHYFYKVESFWGRQTDYISIPVEEGRKAYSPLIQDKIHIIPQGFDFSNVRIDLSFKRNERLQFAYAGAAYANYRDPTRMLEYLATQINRDFTFVVYTKSKDIFTKFKKALGDKLIIKDYVPREQLLFELSRMDFLVNLKNSSTVQAPSKLIDYYLTKRPIIDITSEFNEELVLDEFLRRDYTNQHSREDMTKYDINNVGRRFLELFHNDCN